MASNVPPVVEFKLRYDDVLTYLMKADLTRDEKLDVLLDALLKRRGAFRANLQVGLHHDPDSEYQVDWTVWGVPDEHRGQFMNPSSVHQILIVPVPKEGNDDEAPS